MEKIYRQWKESELNIEIVEKKIYKDTKKYMVIVGKIDRGKNIVEKICIVEKITERKIVVKYRDCKKINAEKILIEIKKK